MHCGVVDKMPGNFHYLGLIHAVFPNARIVHMQRNPIDTCLSIYFQHFSTIAYSIPMTWKIWPITTPSISA